MSNLSNFYRDLRGEPAQGIMDMSKTQKYPLGTRYHENRSGRTFYYAKAGGADLVCGNLISSAALGGADTTTQTDLAVPTEVPKGNMSIGVTSITTAVLKDVFKDGFVAITDGDAAGAMGDMYQVKGHAGCSIGALLTLDLYEPTKRIITAAAAKAGVICNSYNGVIQCPATPTGLVLGVCPTVVTTLYYCWIQTWGIANVLAGGGVAAGLNIVAGPDVGEVDDLHTTTAHEILVGQAVIAINDTDSGFVYLRLTP